MVALAIGGESAGSYVLSGLIGIGILLGCMMGTSLGIAPALLLAPYASVIDLDAPQSLTADRTPAISFADGLLQPPPPELWG